LQQIVDDLYAARGDLFTDLFSRSWALLDEAGKRILMVITFFPDSASVEALSAAADVIGFDFDRATERLTDLSLLDIQQTDLASAPRYVLHPLVRSFAAAQLVEQADFEKAARERWAEWYIELTAKVGLCWDDLSKLDILDHEQGSILVLVEWLSLHKKYNAILHICENASYYYHLRSTWQQQLIIENYRMIAARELGETLRELTALSDFIETFSAYGQHIEKLEELIKHLDVLAKNIELKGQVVYYYFRALYWYHAFGKNDFGAAFEACQAMQGHQSELARWQVVVNQGFIGECFTYQGDLVAGQRLYQDAYRIAQQINFQRASIFMPKRLAQNALLQRDAGTAQSFLDEARTNLQKFADQRSAADIQYQYVQLHLLREELPEARAALIEAIDLFERMGMRHELAEAREELARLEAQIAAAAE
jgi:hypothetical protein